MVCRRHPVLKVGIVDFGVEQATLPNGAEVELAVIRHPGASAVIALGNDGSVAMLSQYRHAVGRYVWEIPAGVRRSSESPIQCAQRELAEEAGLSARRWDHLGSVITVPSFSDEHIDLFLARELHFTPDSRDYDEVISVQRMSFTEALRMIQRGDIIDAKTIVALYEAREFLAQTGIGASAGW